MPAISFSRRQWLGVSALGCGCALASSRGLAEGAASHVSGMTAFARRERLQAAHFTAIDAIKRGLFGWFDERVKAFRNLPVDKQAEVVSLVGSIALVNGAPSAHVDAVFILGHGTARGGYLSAANVWPTLEIFLTDYSTPLLKELDTATDLYLSQLEARGMMSGEKQAINAIAEATQ